jgi:protein gp37
MTQTKIEWTELTWNPTTGCDKVSQGCKFCYAEVMARRLNAMGLEKYRNGFKLTLHKDLLKIPYTWKRPKIVFVNSMSDLFHKDIPLEFIQRVFRVMNDNPQHVFQVLTKRADILLRYHKELNWTHNIWMGVSIENYKTLYRVDLLRNIRAKVKFLSCEPLLGPLPELNLKNIDWVIVGGESGRRPRPIIPEWVFDIHDKCIEANVPFFFKQWGGINKKKTGRILKGKVYSEMPTVRNLLEEQYA